MSDWTLNKFGSRYILMMMFATRIVGLVGGLLTIYYMNLTLRMTSSMRYHWDVSAAISILVAGVMTILLALWETRALRTVISHLNGGKTIGIERAQAAGREAVTFAGRHHFNEAILIPLVTVLPVGLFLWYADNAPFSVLAQITIAAFLGISASLICTFFVIERGMSSVIRFLLVRGIPIEFDSLPQGRLRVRMIVSFSLIIMVTATMISSLASQRAIDIIQQPERRIDAVSNLREHTIYISLVAVVVGVVYSVMLSNSIATRSGQLVEAMKQVQQGSLTKRIEPTGTDEIDVLTRQFNLMVEQLDRNDHIIRDLNANLEQKVKQRTQELLESEKSLQESLQKLQNSDQLKTDFFSNISHELRTPLTMILSPVERILDRDAEQLPPEIVSKLETTRINSHRLLKLINQLLDFSKLEAGHGSVHRSAVDVNNLITNLVTAAQPLAEQLGIDLRTNFDEDLSLVSVDEEKIDTVIGNLLSNALKFTPSGGTVRVGSSLQDGQLQVEVIDTGIGIAAENHHRIFDRFMQIDGSLSRETSGTGLGMALAKELIELHEGHISLESRLGEGSRFWFTIPVVFDETESTRERSKISGTNNSSQRATEHFQRFSDLMVCDFDQPLQKSTDQPVSTDAPTVLVVDDTPEVRSMVGDLLADRYQVIFAKNGAEGLDLARQKSPDLIISDVMMPMIDGYEFCRQTKENPATAGIPFVMLTAKAELSMKIAGLDCGADDYLVKPFEKEELRARVRSLLKLRQLHREIDERNKELKSTLEELRHTQSQLVHSEKMSSLGQLVAGIAHEINNAINAVYNGILPLRKKSQRLQNLVGELIDSPGFQTNSETFDEIQQNLRKISQLAEIIEHGASRTARIVKDLKTFSHPGTEAAETFNLHESIDICLHLMASQMKHKIEVHKKYHGDGMITAPSGELNQVIMNLLSNALQAIPDKGEITISASNTENQTLISIRDNGIGIPQDVRSKIFDPFFTTKEPGVGTGLGLSISYGIINRLGGRIECHSETGLGTEFLITLPNHSEPDQTKDDFACFTTANSSERAMTS